jgi:hypothetical protein
MNPKNYVSCVFKPDPELLIKIFYQPADAEKFIASKPELALYVKRIEIE